MIEDTLEQIKGQQPTLPETPRRRAKRHAEMFQQACNSLDDALNIVRELQEEKQEVFDERSERWQESEKGQEAQEELSTLEQAELHIEEARGFLNELNN
jgi:hypothetical protein